MAKTETNKQWTTYRILDATIDNPDLADPFTVGEAGAGKDFIVHATASSGKLHWDEDANILYIIATTMMGYGSQFQFTPGGVGAGTGISFYNTEQYIRSIASNVLEISGQAFLNVASKLVLASTIALTYDVTPSLVGELALASDNRLEYCVSTAPIVYRVPFYDHTNTSDVTLPTGVGLRLGDKLRLQYSAVAATAVGELYLDTDQRLTYYTNTGVEYKAAILDDEGKLHIPLSAAVATREGQLYHSSTTGRLTFNNGVAEYQIPMQDLTLKRLSVGGPLRLHATADGSAYTLKGDIFLRTLDDKLVFYDGATFRTIQSS